MATFDNNINIGDEFYYHKHGKAIVHDIIRHWSTKDNDFNGETTILAKMLTGFATNTFDVAKATVVMNRIKK